MSFSWNKWRQYIIEEVSVNEEMDEVGEIIPFFHDAMKMDLIRSIDYQRAVEAGGESEDLDAFESTQEFQQIGKSIIDAAVDALEASGRETHYLHQKFAQGGGKPIEGADISNAVNILKKGGKINPEADEIDPEDLDAAADYFDNMEEGYDVEMSDVVRNPKHGFMPDKILKSFIEDFEKASMSTDDIPYAQEAVIDAYMKTFPHMDQFIQLWLDQNHNKELKKFQNVADDPEVGGMDMMGEDDAIDEAINEMALDRAMEIANKLDAMQNDLEATLSDDEIDTLSDAIMLLRQKKTLSEKVAVSNDPLLKALEAELAEILTDEEIKILATLAKEQMNESPLITGGGAVKIAIQYLLRTTLGPIILGPMVKKLFAKLATKFPEKKELIMKMEPIVDGAIAAGKIGSMYELAKFIRGNNEELAEMILSMSSELATMIKDSVKSLAKRK